MPGSQRNRAFVDSRRSSKDMLLMPCGGLLYRRPHAQPPPTFTLSCNQRQLHYLLTNFVPAPKRLPGNRCTGSPSSSAPLHISRSETLRPQGCVSPPNKGSSQEPGPALHCPHLLGEEREGSGGPGGGVEDQILNLLTRKGASIGTGGDITFEYPDRGHTVVPLQLNYPVHNGEASRIDTSIESVSAALWGPTISISAEIDLLPREATIAEQSF